MKNLFNFALAGTVALCGFFACLGGDNKGGGGGSSGNIKIDSIDQANGRFVVTLVTHQCEGPTVMSETTTVRSRYLIAGGSLYVWEEDGDCGADMYSGSSQTIFGTWILTPPAVAIPVASRPAYCSDVVPPDDPGLNAMVENIPGGQASMTVSASNVALSVSGQICAAQTAAEFITNLATGVTVTGSTCTSVSLRNEANQKTAQITSSTGDGLVTVTFQHGSATCTGYEHVAIPGGSLPNCSLPELRDQAMLSCILASGFFGP